jgi:hypothetical protein
MSNKAIKRNRKEMKRIVRASIGDGMESLASITRKRPKWIPKRIWVLAYLPLFPRKYLHLIYKQLD